MIRALIVAIALALVAVPAASAAVVAQDFGPAAEGVPIVGSNAHLPPLDATGVFDAGPIVGDEIIAFRKAGGYQADIRASMPAPAPTSTRGSRTVAARTPPSRRCAAVAR